MGLINELAEKISKWESSIADYKCKYKTAQNEAYRLASDIYWEKKRETPNNEILISLEKQKDEAEEDMAKAQNGLNSIFLELKQNIFLIDDNMVKIEKSTNGLIGMGSSSQYAKVGLRSSAVKAKLQEIKEVVLHFKKLRDKLIELCYECDPKSGDDDKPKVKRI